MKIIFLDIDGVLNLKYPGHDKYGRLFHPHFIDNLRTILEATGAKIVMSSSWKINGIDWLRDMWKDRNLPGEIVDITPDLYYEYSVLRDDDDYCRGDEIKQWLDNNSNITSYVIIDDDTDMLEEQKKYFVRTSKNRLHPDCIDVGYGLTKICAEKAIEILNNMYNIGKMNIDKDFEFQVYNNRILTKL